MFRISSHTLTDFVLAVVCKQQNTSMLCYRLFLIHFTKILTGVPVIDNETEELIAFAELKWETDDYGR
jgi:hypothetical protein